MNLSYIKVDKEITAIEVSVLQSIWTMKTLVQIDAMHKETLQPILLF